MPELMKLQTQPSPWTCFPTSVAMVLGIPVLDLLKHLPDGSKIAFDGYNDSRKYRGYNPAEMAEVLLRVYGKHMILLQKRPIMVHIKQTMVTLPASACPICAGTGDVQHFSGESYRPLLLKKYCGVIQTGHHSVAWDTKHVLDPGGKIYRLEKLQNIGDFYPII